VTDIDTSLREYVFGGQLGLREKQHLAKVLRAAAGKEGGDPDEGVFPPYFAALLELSSRFLRRPAQASTVLRYAEWASEAHVVRQASPAAEVFGERFDDLAAKLLADVCGFLVSAAGLDAEFRARARVVLAPATLGAPNSSASESDARSEASAEPVPAPTRGSAPAQEPLPIDSDATSSEQDSSR
jgi:hypothetical protein